MKELLLSCNAIKDEKDMNKVLRNPHIKEKVENIRYSMAKLSELREISKTLSLNLCCMADALLTFKSKLFLIIYQKLVELII